MAKIPGLPSFFFFSFFTPTDFYFVTQEHHPKSTATAIWILHISLLFSWYSYQMYQRNSKQVYLFLLKVLNRKKKLFSECLRTIGEIKAYFWNYYWLHHMLLFSEFFVNIQKIPFLWFWAFKTRFLLFSIDTYLDLSLALNGLWTSNWSYNNNISYKVWGKLDSSF